MGMRVGAASRDCLHLSKLVSLPGCEPFLITVPPTRRNKTDKKPVPYRSRW